MIAADLTPGESYAARLKGTPWQAKPVEVVFIERLDRGSRIRVRVEDGEELDARLTELICPWGEVTALLRDEEAQRRLNVTDNQVWDDVTVDAITHVLEASGEHGWSGPRYGADAAVARRLWARAGQDGSPLDHDAANYVDRHGRWRLSLETALLAAHELAVREPALFEACLAADELSLRRESWGAESLARSAPVWALIRSWTGEGLRGAGSPEIRRLQGLVRQAAQLLREAGDEAGADALESALDGRVS